jgi:hypothetical protein
VYVPNTAEYAGMREGEPAISGTLLTFSRQRFVAPQSSISLTFSVYVPVNAATHRIEASALSGAILVDATEDPDDYSPATAVIIQNGESPAPVGVSIVGQVVDENGRGLPNVVVYLYRGAGIESFDQEYSINREYGTLSTITNLDGTYAFRDIERGVYRVEPNFTGLAFFPSDVRVATGFFAPVITARHQSLNDSECEIIRRAETIVHSDAVAREEMIFGLKLADFYLKEASKNLRGSRKELVLHELTRARGQLQRSYTRILNSSELLPKLELRCPIRPGCQQISMRDPLQTYRAQLNILRKLSFFIVRTSRLAGLPVKENRWSRLAIHIREAHNSAVNAWRSLPLKTFVCSQDP